MQKPRVIKDFEKLDVAIQEQIKLVYPTGFFEHLISYVDKDGNERYALPFETDDKYYMVRMSISEAKKLINEDDDYDDNGVLRNDIQEMYQEKYQDVDYLGDFDAIDAPVADIEIPEKDLDIADDEDEDEDEPKKRKFKDEDEYDDDDDDDIDSDDYDEEEDDEDDE